MKVNAFTFLSIFLILFVACSQTNTVSNQMTSEDTSQKVVLAKQQTETIVTTITLNETNAQGETLKKDSIVEKEIPSTPHKNDYINLWIYPQDPLYFTTLDSVKHEVHLTKATDQACTMSVDGQ